jgi:hypothetical protein
VRATPACRRVEGAETPRRGGALHSLKTEQRKDRALRSRTRSPKTTTGGSRKGSSSERLTRECTEPAGLVTDQVDGELLRKEVIQPHLPVRLPCYDFTPIAGPTFDSSLLAVGPLASGVTNFRGVTGGVYKARERIHPGVADPGLLATPASRSRVADSDPN